MRRGYLIKDDENEIRKVCGFLEKRGFAYKMKNDFVIQYESEEHIVLVEYERYGESVFVDLVFKTPKYGDQKYSIGWMAKVDEEVDFEKYIAKPYTKPAAVGKRMQFIRDYSEKVFDEEYCNRMKKKYESLPL